MPYSRRLFEEPAQHRTRGLPGCAPTPLGRRTALQIVFVTTAVIISLAP
jgi:hypothetical protein